MKKEIDYKKLYLKQYKNIPNYYFWGTLITLGLGAIVTGIIFMIDWFMIGFGIMFGGMIVAFGLAFLNRFISAVAISQKVVVADALLSGNNGSASIMVEEELPEL